MGISGQNGIHDTDYLPDPVPELSDPVPEFPSDMLTDDTEASVVPSQRPKDRAMEQRVRHWKLQL